MSGFRGDAFGRDHDRARELAAARLAEPLGQDEAGWLQAHLAWCAPCRAVAAEYDAQRLSLRALRLDAPVPPRDLWARTAAAMEADAGARPVHGRTSAGRAVRGRQPFPVAPLAALLVVAVAVGMSMLNGVPTLLPPTPGSPDAGGPTVVAPTPIPVAAREVPLVRKTADGTLVLQVGRIDQVCPMGVASCGSEASIERTELGRIPAGEASDVLLSPTRSHLVVLDRSSDSGGIYVVAMADIPAPTQPPRPTTGPDMTSDPTVPPEPTASPEPSASPSPVEPSVSPEPGETAPASSPEPTPPVEVSPIPGGPVQIVGDVVLVGSVAGYSPDGTRLAFTARPSDGSTGPDVYLWRVGDAQAAPITSGHDVIFADWLGDRLLVSRAVGGGADGVASPVTAILDPATLEETPVQVPAMWRPAVDPLARAAVWWDGSVTRSEDGYSWVPAAGRLVIGPWPRAASDDTASEPPARTGAPVVVADGTVPEWQVRWDETGTHLAVWIADDEGASTGRLSLYLIDPLTGTIAGGDPLLEDAVADQGFSLGAGRLAWSFRDADGNEQVKVVAWSDDALGEVSLSPEGELVVVR